MLDVRFVTDRAAAAAAAREVGFPVALKATGLAHLAKTEAGGIALDLQDEGEVQRAFDRMVAARPDAMRPAAVQQHVRAGRRPAASGSCKDTWSSGSTVAIGPGGAGAESFPDDATRLVPLTADGAAGLVAASPIAAALAPADRAALVELVGRVAWLADAVPELAELTVTR